ncbi:hypothetical protein B7463_g3147, partial [Scytalidium lignicola]
MRIHPVDLAAGAPYSMTAEGDATHDHLRRPVYLCSILQYQVRDLRVTARDRRCSEKLGQPPEGITMELEKALRSKKKSHPHQTEEERWKEIYCVLFSKKHAPSPYFEPIQEDVVPTPASEILDNYAEYSLREIPPLFQHKLQTQLGMEDELMQHLSEILVQCLERILLDYRDQLGLTPSTSTFSPSSLRDPRMMTSNEGMPSPGQIISPPSSNSSSYLQLHDPKLLSPSTANTQDWDSDRDTMIHY